MSEIAKHSRRGALGALASIPALALPVGAVSAATESDGAGPDAGLFQLLDEVRAAHERSKELLIRLDKLGDENPPPDWQPALVQTEDDARFMFSDPYFVGNPYEDGRGCVTKRKTRLSWRR